MEYFNDLLSRLDRLENIFANCLFLYALDEGLSYLVFDISLQ